MTRPCAEPLSLGELLAYYLGELDDERQSGVEKHYFGCEACSRRLEAVARLALGVTAVVREGKVSSSVTSELVRRGVERGLRVRSYQLQAGEQVACTAAPSDDFVAIRLGLDADPASSVDVEVEWVALDTREVESRRVSDVCYDRQAGEIVLLFAGDQVRQFPKSRWTMDAVVRSPSGSRRVGPYTLNHTPWEQLGA